MIIASFDKAASYNSCSITKTIWKVSQKSIIKVTKSLKLIHINLISLITSIMINKQYYILFKNNYNKILKIYDLKFKDQVYDWYIKFKILIKNHLKFTINHLQINNNTEYDNGQFITALKTSEI